MTLSRAFVGLSFITLASLTACDEVDYRKADVPKAITSDSVKIDSSLVDTTKFHPASKVLIYDFTGQRCSNCPTSHRAAEALQNIYGDSVVIVMGVHCGFFAEPDVSPNNPQHAYTADYRTDAGNELDDLYHASNRGLPQGSIDGSKDLAASSTWAAITAQDLAQKPIGGLFLRMTGNTVSVRSVHAFSPGQDLRLSLFVLRDSIIGWQKDNTTNVGGYYHRHVLRSRPVNSELFIAKDFRGIKNASYTIPIDSVDHPWRNVVVATLMDSTNRVLLVSEVKQRTN